MHYRVENFLTDIAADVLQYVSTMTMYQLKRPSYLPKFTDFNIKFPKENSRGIVPWPPYWEGLRRYSLDFTPTLATPSPPRNPLFRLWSRQCLSWQPTAPNTLLANFIELGLRRPVGDNFAWATTVHGKYIFGGAPAKMVAPPDDRRKWLLKASGRAIGRCRAADHSADSSSSSSSSSNNRSLIKAASAAAAAADGAAVVDVRMSAAAARYRNRWRRVGLHHDLSTSNAVITWSTHFENIYGVCRWVRAGEGSASESFSLGRR